MPNSTSDVTVRLSRESARQLDVLLALMERASADPILLPITMDVLHAQGFTREALGAAHDAIRKGRQAVAR